MMAQLCSNTQQPHQLQCIITHLLATKTNYHRLTELPNPNPDYKPNQITTSIIKVYHNLSNKTSNTILDSIKTYFNNLHNRTINVRCLLASHNLAKTI